MKVLSVVGTRPQFVKASPVSDALRPAHEEVLVHTGQHYDEALSAVFFEELAIPEPDHHLGVGSDTHARQTAAMMEGLDDLLARERPDVVLVYGDTNTTLAAALAAVKRDHDLAHVEAGLRSHDWSMPEEVNRVLADHCSDLLFAPTERAVDNLRAEGITAGVHRTGDVMFDAMIRAKERALDRSTVVEDLGLADGAYVLATVHREGNTEAPDRLAGIVEGLAAVPEPVVLPAHPRTEAALEAHGLAGRAHEAIELVEPQGYLDFLALLDGAERVATDSGGVQKEAFYLATPCVTLRDRTEWAETVECGWNVLAGTDPDRIARELTRDRRLPERPSLYGDGDAAPRIAEVLGRERP